MLYNIIVGGIYTNTNYSQGGRDQRGGGRGGFRGGRGQRDSRGGGNMSNGYSRGGNRGKIVRLKEG